MTLVQLFTAIANAIRGKTGSSSSIPAENFPNEISNIETGITPTGTIAITENGTVDVTNYASADVNVASSASYPPDWTELGYSNTPQAIINDFNYAKDIKDNWDNTITSMNAKYYNNKIIALFPNVDTQNVKDMQYCFGQCTYMQEAPLLNTQNVTNMEGMFLTNQRLVSVPQFNTSKVTKVYNMFSGCPNLSTTSLNNILGMCINISPNYSRTKSLYEMGFRSNYYPAEVWQGLSNYQEFLDAGWTIGY